MTQPATGAPVTSAPMVPPPASARSFVVLFLLLGFGVAAFWYFARTPPELVFTNRLMAPVRLTIGGEVRTIAVSDTVKVRVPRGRTTVAEWELVRPLSANGELMGVPVRGSIVTDGRGRKYDVAESWGRNADYFAPLISNATATPLRVVVNAGLRDAQDCRCAVRPGARRTFIGYYPLYGNSTVQARAADGRHATFRQLGPEVKALDGTLGLNFAERDLRR